MVMGECTAWNQSTVNDACMTCSKTHEWRTKMFKFGGGGGLGGGELDFISLSDYKKMKRQWGCRTR